MYTYRDIQRNISLIFFATVLIRPQPIKLTWVNGKECPWKEWWKVHLSSVSNLKLFESTGDGKTLLIDLVGWSEAKFLLMTLDVSLLIPSSSSTNRSLSLAALGSAGGAGGGGGGATLTSTLSEAEGSFRPNSTLDVSKYFSPEMLIGVIFTSNDLLLSEPGKQGTVRLFHHLIYNYRFQTGDLGNYSS